MCLDKNGVKDPFWWKKTDIRSSRLVPESEVQPWLRQIIEQCEQCNQLSRFSALVDKPVPLGDARMDSTVSIDDGEVVVAGGTEGVAAPTIIGPDGTRMEVDLASIEATYASANSSGPIRVQFANFDRPFIP